LKPKPEIPLALLTTIPNTPDTQGSPTSATNTNNDTSTSESANTQLTSSPPTSSPPASPISSSVTIIPTPSLSDQKNNSSISSQKHQHKSDIKDKILSHLTVIITIAILAILIRKFIFTPSINPFTFRQN